MKTREQLTRTINRLHKLADSLRLYIGLGQADQADYDDLDNLLDRIDRLGAEIDRQDKAAQAWRNRHKAGLLAYRARMKAVMLQTGGVL